MVKNVVYICKKNAIMELIIVYNEYTLIKNFKIIFQFKIDNCFLFLKFLPCVYEISAHRPYRLLILPSQFLLYSFNMISCQIHIFFY